MVGGIEEGQLKGSWGALWESECDSEVDAKRKRERNGGLFLNEC